MTLKQWGTLSSQIEKILNVKVLTEKLFVTNLKKVVLEENYRGH